jgi:predicted nucleic acid-binding protein
MIVLDASAALELLLRTKAGDVVRDRIMHANQSLHVPHVFDLEIAQVLRRYHLAGDLREPRAREALKDAADLDVERYSHEPLLPRIWQLRNVATAYDAAYVALAEALRAPLLTSDARLARSTGHAARIDLVA